MDSNNLSQRLLKVANYIPQGARLADIGSDHAYLPAYLLLNDAISFAVAGEVVPGPYENACHEVKKQNLNDKITVRLADGLAAIHPEDQIDTIAICGMGGTLITEILNANPEKLNNHPLLVLQPNVGEKNVRQWIVDHGYRILNEEILEEDHHIYEIIVAEYAPQTAEKLSLADLTFGPYLRKNKGEIFIKKWQSEQAKIQTVLKQLEQAKNMPVAKKEALLTQYQEIEGMLND
ncbi:tRNA (adenine(22)-N(1))-methyltransferase [Ligilactobacillus ceti]|uniref:SAM-dependent methyltransferase n=1 Tax=Ligilactobacillus ceti DSM 22408 TaxID=1122146 RepID=A0A0R2KRC8_9LACO|nr:tRNA (adenine(22)-N(1))-methyltransferase TrmK [Ligilactobacillus ceti]KRN88855.1 hypothetical protein IV53_GL000825 [Ligilactobacillus ceti DSM 22408]